jgi:hypothetical protein
MADKCYNCRTTLHCGCQRIIASDGTPCCNNCIQGYEQKLIAIKTNTPND